MVNKFKRLTRADRHDLKILARLTMEESAQAGESYLCNTINISSSGALVETGSMIPVGSLLKYSFSMPGVVRTVEVTGEVVRGERSGAAMPRESVGAENPRKLIRYGIMFLNMKEEDRLAMEDFLSGRAEAPKETEKPGTLDRRGRKNSSP